MNNKDLHKCINLLRLGNGHPEILTPAERGRLTLRILSDPSLNIGELMENMKGGKTMSYEEFKKYAIEKRGWYEVHHGLFITSNNIPVRVFTNGDQVTDVALNIYMGEV